MKAHNEYYWQNKQERTKFAKQHTADMEKKYRKEIEICIDKTKIYDNRSQFSGHPLIDASMTMEVMTTDTVSALFNCDNQIDGKIAVLNFASYKNPGGGFMIGSRAQEECLCQESFLYNVLKAFEKSYYEINRNDLNRALYRNKALYSPDVIFEHNGQKRVCDVITCASPNFSAASKFVDRKENNRWLRNRIEFILKIAKAEAVDTLILGAFGCGVFQQDPEVVARYFIELSESIFVDSKVRIIFAVIPPLPNQTDNMTPFIKIVDKWNEKCEK